MGDFNHMKMPHGQGKKYDSKGYLRYEGGFCFEMKENCCKSERHGFGREYYLYRDGNELKNQLVFEGLYYKGQRIFGKLYGIGRKQHITYTGMVCGDKLKPEVIEFLKDISTDDDKQQLFFGQIHLKIN